MRSRLEQTLEEMKYQRRLDENLTEPATKGKLEELQIYRPPPKNMTGPTQTFQLAAVEPGRFDVESSFIEPEKQSLHVLARVKRPKTPAKKGAAQGRTAPRGDFNTEVVDLIKNVYGAELDLADFKDETKGRQHVQVQAARPNAKNVQIYLYGNKNSPYEVALIFEYPKTEHNTVNPKIGLCLESFAVGDKAKRAFAGGEAEEEGRGSGRRGGSTTADLIASLRVDPVGQLGPCRRSAPRRPGSDLAGGWALHQPATIAAGLEGSLRRRGPRWREAGLRLLRRTGWPRAGSTRLEGS